GPIAAQPLSRYAPILGEESVQQHLALAAAARERFHGRAIWNLSSTARGGGVAEMLAALLPYVRGVGVDMVWLVVEAEPEFFALTKRLHHALHGSPGDGRPLDDDARQLYEAALKPELQSLKGVVQENDIVLLHDPQTAGLIPGLIEHGAKVIWRCHVGQDGNDAEQDAGWAFLAPYVSLAHATVFSRRSFVPACCDSERDVVIHPSIDPFAPKNQQLAAPVVEAILGSSGLLRGVETDALPLFALPDGSPSRVVRAAALEELEVAPSADVPLIVQVSRWDPLKDPVGVIGGFRAMLDGGRGADAHLMIAGPDPTSVTDDPEGLSTYQSVVAAREELPDEIRHRVHLACLPMDDLEENAAIVNALQRHATIIVQKSLAEGFGLTVTEGMIKGRPVVASAVGGILEQITDGETGKLLSRPDDPEEFASTVGTVLGDRALAARLGAAAERRATEHFTGLRSLRQYAELLTAVDQYGAPRRPGLSARVRGMLRRRRLPLAGDRG
ncbi:MAG: glycosyltransferase, partial [Dehalococcoidia bacterium]